MTYERIRYRAVAPTVLESLQIFGHAANGARYRVRLNNMELMWYVLDAETEIVASSGAFKTTAQGKIRAKRSLEELGITFSSGRRNRTKTQPSS